MGILAMKETQEAARPTQVEQIEWINEFTKARSKAIKTDLEKQSENFKSRLRDWQLSRTRGDSSFFSNVSNFG